MGLVTAMDTRKVNIFSDKSFHPGLYLHLFSSKVLYALQNIIFFEWIMGRRSSPFPVPFEQRLPPDTEVTASSWSNTPLLLPTIII
ncbi:hypothetical protein BpHYR1_041115 [Brachionus plicatilis]|uniref:Uncharacterized protein n=1 Tax=Brachionus plicatilis TaxID=10195 RepID=A0A3M7S3L0_BRAPC|nr:hypothetical protein BpHYR1_041115 [Brachionus plicatilis]